MNVLARHTQSSFSSLPIGYSNTSVTRINLAIFFLTYKRTNAFPKTSRDVSPCRCRDNARLTDKLTNIRSDTLKLKEAGITASVAHTGTCGDRVLVLREMHT